MKRDAEIKYNALVNTLLILVGKTISLLSRTFGRGSGSTWPGHIALMLNKNFIKQVLSNSKTKIIYIARTNGKTTTGKMIQAILKENGHTVFQNSAGANLLNGLASSILLHSSILGTLKYDFAVFEVDENVLPHAIEQYQPDYLILLNLFRDQLDRYGEINSIVQKWTLTMKQLNKATIVILNADDPQIAYLGHEKKDNIKYFGLDDTKLANIQPQHAADSIHCPKCHEKLIYARIYYSHIGEWNCPRCQLKRPNLDISDFPIFPLAGTYNKYNTLAAVLTAKLNNISNETIEQSLKGFQPAFGRQEKIVVRGKTVQIYLSKNPTSMNQSLQAIAGLGAKQVLFALNDRVPDGKDVSWIWDVDFEEYINKFENIIVSGERCYDMGLRIKYANSSTAKNQKLKTIENLDHAIKQAMEQLNNNNNGILYILPTYSAMLEVRKILTGKKIL